MKVFYHHIYEYEKGLRDLVLHTMPANLRQQAEEKLRQRNVSFITCELSPTRINIFFGATQCVAVVQSFGHKPLNHYSPEEDFILGIILGYDRLRQCSRYMGMLEKESASSQLKSGK